MTLVSQISDVLVDIGTEFKAVRTEKQNADADLTAIAGLDSTSAGTLATDGSGWIKKTYAQFKTALSLTKSDVGLANVDNTSDANKPISTATQTALDGKQASLGFTPENTANKGVASGYASLDGAGKVPSSQLPAYVDEVQEYANFAALPSSGQQTGIIYVTIDNGKTFRWSGSAYTEISASPGTTDAVPEGSSNLYYTQTRVDNRINSLLDAQMGDETTDFAAIFAAALV